MNNYEYKTIRELWSFKEDCSDDCVDDLITGYLNTIGTEGWELINYNLDINHSTVYDTTTTFLFFGIAKRCAKSNCYKIDEILTQ